jgi:hypothetical protein
MKTHIRLPLLMLLMWFKNSLNFGMSTELPYAFQVYRPCSKVMAAITAVAPKFNFL